MEHLDEESRELIDWLQRQPQGAQIEWTADEFSLQRPFAMSWVDVRIPEACQELESSWLWTIENPEYHDNPEYEGIVDPLDPTHAWNFAVDCDLDVYEVDNSFAHPAVEIASPDVDNPVYIAVPKGTALRYKQWEEIYRAEERKKISHQVVSGWSPGCVSNALAKWAQEYANRPDLTFRWNPDFLESEGLQRAREHFRKYREGQGKLKPFKKLREALEEEQEEDTKGD